LEETEYFYHLRNIAGAENFNYCVLQDNKVSHVSIHEGDCCIRCAVSRLVHLVCACYTQDGGCSTFALLLMSYNWDRQLVLISDLYVIIVAPGLGLN